ncbi:HAD-IIIA family hydrolase [Bacillus sp. NEB1478]|uniref:HAD-IIIA family hydrolase n=1 Tax=Bacillus sp. NEB1478 TaxID=3073816 RepID=UPI002873182D|nr:HAD-IIIA family hydrolase [Bacillus sp. NEB1478]WNB90818.1 HAD-IIIA family hydrolase [Bacillus sp. NEB1478]
MTLQAVFLDRDGTIGGSMQIEYPGELKLFPFTKKAIESFQKQGIRVFSFTNQPGISQGMAKEEDFIKELKGFGFEGIYLCPHHHRDGCFCRKPGTGMLDKAAFEHQLDLTRCAVIGDRWTDIEAAKKVGCTAILVLTGSGAASWQENHLHSPVQPDYTAENIHDAAEWLFSTIKV